METEVVVVLQKKKATPKPKKMFPCPLCDYKGTRAYNVQRHLPKHYEKPPKELQHICPYPNCNFASLRWDNLCRHIQRIHRVERKRREKPVVLSADENTKIIIEDVENPDPTEEYLEEIDPSDEDEEDLEPSEDYTENPATSDEDPVYEPTDEELASLLSDECASVPSDDISEKLEPPKKKKINKRMDSQKINKLSKQKDQNIVKPKRTYKNGKRKYYECITCNYRTNRNYNIKRHLAKHKIGQEITEEVTLHVCVISGCGFSTPRWDNLCRHVKRVHPEPEELPPEEW